MPNFFDSNLTLEEAKDLALKWQRKYELAVCAKLHAQGIAFDLMYPNKKNTKIDELKAQAFYYRAELEKVVKQREKVKLEIKSLLAENYGLRTQLEILLEKNKGE